MWHAGRRILAHPVTQQTGNRSARPTMYRYGEARRQSTRGRTRPHSLRNQNPGTGARLSPALAGAHTFAELGVGNARTSPTACGSWYTARMSCWRVNSVAPPWRTTPGAPCVRGTWPGACESGHAIERRRVEKSQQHIRRVNRYGAVYQTNNGRNEVLVFSAVSPHRGRIDTSLHEACVRLKLQTRLLL